MGHRPEKGSVGTESPVRSTEDGTSLPTKIAQRNDHGELPKRETPDSGCGGPPGLTAEGGTYQNSRRADAAHPGREGSGEGEFWSPGGEAGK